MKRRTLLVASGWLTASLAGCLGGPEVSSSGPFPAGMSVDTQHRVGSHLESDDVSPSGERPRSEQVVFVDRETARERLRTESAIQEFLEETDFVRSYLLVVVAAAWPSAYEMAVRRVERTDDGLTVAISISEPGGTVGDDAAVHSLAARITDEEAGVPDRVRVEINGEQTGTATPAE